MPLGLTESVLDCPAGTEEGDAKGAPVDGGTQGVTVTVVAGLSAVGAHAPPTRTQYEVVDVGLTVTDELVAPPIGLVVLPEAPTYHWYVKGPVPVGASEIMLDPPNAIEEGLGTGVGAEGGAQVTVTTAVLLFANWTPLHEFDTRTQ